jgi:hypothetical protein
MLGLMSGCEGLTIAIEPITSSATDGSEDGDQAPSDDDDASPTDPADEPDDDPGDDPSSSTTGPDDGPTGDDPADPTDEDTDSDGSTTDPLDPVETTGDADAHPASGHYTGSIAGTCTDVGPIDGDLDFSIDPDGGLHGTVVGTLLGVGTLAGDVDDDGALTGEADALVDTCAFDGTIADDGQGEGTFACPVTACTGSWTASRVL